MTALISTVAHTDPAGVRADDAAVAGQSGHKQANAAAREVRRPWLIGTLMALIPAVLTGVGFGFAAGIGLDERGQYLGGAAGATLSALLGLVVMKRSRPSFAQFGFRRPVRLADALWLIPVLLVPLITLAATGVTVSPTLIPGLLWLALAAGVNEEVWFRGLILAAFRARGRRYAVIASSAFFGALHLINLAGGKSVEYAALQLLFAALIGLVFALLVAHTRSLWPAIGIHAAYDLAAYLGGDVLSPAALAALGLQSVLLTGYAVVLWRRLPR